MGKQRTRIWTAAIFACISAIFMAASLFFSFPSIYKKQITPEQNSEKIIKEAIAISLLLPFPSFKGPEPPDDYVERAFSTLKKPSELTDDDYKKVKDLYL